MKIYKDFTSYNQEIGLSKPLDSDIDVGYYDPLKITVAREAVVVDFYRISIKIRYKRKSTPDVEPVSAIFFNTPALIIEPGWDAEPIYTGMYLQLSKKIIEENRFLFKTYLDYGQHEALYLTDDEVEEVSTVFRLMIKYYNREKIHYSVLIPYVNVLVSLVEVFYKRQFSTDPKKYNHIINDFQQSLTDYYNQPVKQLPNV